MTKSILLLCLCFFSVPCFALRSLYLGLAAGQVTFRTGPAEPAIGYALNAGARLNKTVDLVAGLQRSVHGGGNGISRFSTLIAAEFRPMNLDSLDVMLGLGTGVHFLGLNGVSDTRLDGNFGGTVDLILGKEYRIGVGARVHFLSEGTLGNNFQTIMVRFGYVFDMMEQK